MPIIYWYMNKFVDLKLYLYNSIDFYKYNEYVCKCMEVGNGSSCPNHRGNGGVFEANALHGAGLCQAGNSAGPQSGQGMAVL
jgi:hypothetical protein